MPQKLKRHANAANPNTAAALDVRIRTAMVVLWASPGFLVFPRSSGRRQDNAGLTET